MTHVLYAQKLSDHSGLAFTESHLRTVFSPAGGILRDAQKAGIRTAYFFIDPLLNPFAAGSRFYFEILDSGPLPNIHTYKTGAGPIHAVSDAQTLLDAGIVELVAIFAYEPLLYSKQVYGRAAITRAMNSWLQGASLLACYNRISDQLCRVLSISTDVFAALKDALYQNYCATYNHLHGAESARKERGKNLAEMGGGMFYLTDVPNPDIDFAGGIILGNDNMLTRYSKPGVRSIRVKASAHEVVPGGPAYIPLIVGGKGGIFPHLRRVFVRLECDAGIDLAQQLTAGTLLLNAYTCYPPIPIAFLLAGGFIKNLEEIPQFLAQHALTVDGGMSLARAPWNCPALSALIDMCQALRTTSQRFGLIHGNGGIGDGQGLLLLEKE